MERRIAEGLEALGLSPAPAQRLALYGRLLIEKNQVMNLTAITQPDQVVDLHILDSAALLTRYDLAGKRLIDVGTGAGLPGMVLKIMEPSLELTLLDGLKKRLDWLEEVCGLLGLEGVTFLHGRAEEESLKEEHRDGYDYATARAVAAMNVLCEMCLPYVKVGGRFLAMKSVDSDMELSMAAGAIKTLGGKALAGWEYTIPGCGVRHRVLPVEKTGGTPKGYPRRWAKIQKAPL